MFRRNHIAIALLLSLCATAQAIEVRPLIQGGLTDECWNSSPYPDCDYSTSAFAGDSINSLNDAHLVLSADYIELRGIHTSHSRGRCIQAKGRDASPDDELDGLRIYNNKWEKCGWNAVFERDMYDIVIKGNQLSLWALCESQELNDNNNAALLPTGGAGNCGKQGAPGGIMISSSNDDRPGTQDGAQGLMEGNICREGWGECINVLSSSHVIVRKNHVSHSRSGGIYLDAATHVVVELNVAQGYREGSPDCGIDHTSGCNNGGGTINTNTENTAVISDVGPHVIRANLIANGSRAMNFTMSDNAKGAGSVFSLQIYQNTLLGSQETAPNQEGSFRFTHNDYTFDEFEAINNYVHSYTEDMGCFRAYSVHTWRNNGWHVTPFDSDCYDAATDVISASVPGGFGDYRLWTTATTYTQIIAAVVPTNTITGEGDGTLDSTNHQLPFDTHFISALWDEMDTVGVCNDTKANFNRKAPCYIDGTAVGASPNIGAGG